MTVGFHSAHELMFYSLSFGVETNDCSIPKNTNPNSSQIDLEALVKVKNDYPNNPMIGYLNINSLRNKIHSLRELVLLAPLDIFYIDETKLDDSFPNLQFHIENYQFPPFRRDTNSKGGGKIVFVKEGLIAKRLKEIETKSSETIAIELTISKKKCCILFAYRPPKQSKEAFFQEMTKCLSNIVNKYDK